MKTIISFVLVIIVFIQFGYAQDEFESAFEKENTIAANLGLTTIGEQVFVGFRVQPEFSFGKFGIGLDVPLLYGIESGALRTEEFDTGAGILRMIRYFRYGRKKKDNIYVRMGDMTGEQLGFGAIVGNYSNAISFERRKTGISLDLLFKKKLGVEAIYSDLNFDGSQKLLAIRPYYKPLTEIGIPILRTLEIGLSYVSDKDKYEEVTEKAITSNTTFTRDGNNAFGVDVGVTLIKNILLKLTWDAQYAHLAENKALKKDISLHPNNYSVEASYGDGSGYATGVEAQVRFIANVFHLNARLERQWYGKNYIPQFYNFAYEINKDARLLELIDVKKAEGIYGRLGTEILGLVKVEGELLLPDDLEESNRGAIVGINLQTKEIANFKARGKYIKGQLTDLDDAFKFDSRSLANILVTYRLNNFMEVGVDYQWTYAEKEDGTFGAVNQIRPYVGVNISL